MKERKKRLTKKEKFNLMKDKVFTVFHELDEIELFGNELKWEDKNYENQLLTNIQIMIDNNLEKSFRKAISFVIIGAFAYVIPDIKKTYSDIDFI